MASQKFELIITGDGKAAVKALKDVGDEADRSGSRFDGLGGKLGNFAKTAAAGLAVVGGAAIGAGVALFAVGDTFDQAFDTIRIGTGATGKDLEGLQESFRNVFAAVPADAETVGTAIADVNTRLGLTGVELEARSGQLVNLARIIDADINTVVGTSADVLNNWGVAAGDQEAALDSLFRITQATGIGWEDLSAEMSKNGVVLREAGLGFEEAGALLGTLAQNGIDASAVMPALSKSLATAAKDGVPAEQMLADTFALIKNAPNDTAAAAVAMEVFGAKAGPQFSNLIREGKLSYEDLMATVAGSSETIDGAAKDTMDFAESFQLFKNNVMLALEAPAREIFGALGDVMTQLTPVLTEVAGLLGESIGQVIEALLPVVMDLVEAFAPLLPVFGDLAATLVSSLLPPIVTLVEALVPIVPLIADIVVMVVDMFAPVLVELVNALAPVVTMFIESLQPVLEQLKPIFAQLGVTLVDFVKNGIAPMLPSLMELSAAFVPLLPPLLQIGTELLNALLPALVLLTPMFVELADKTLSVVVPAVEWLAGGLQGLADWMREVIGQPGELRDNFVNGLQVIKDKAIEVFDWFKGLPGMLWDIAKNAGRDLANGIISGINAIISAWNALEFGIPGFDPPGPGPSFGGITIGTPNIPYLPYVAAESGALLTHPTMLLAAESAKARAGGGEIVSPVATMRDAMRAELAAVGGGGVTIQVSGVIVGTEAELGRVVTRSLEEWRRAGGRNPWTN